MADEPLAGPAGSALLRWRVGDVTITRIVEKDSLFPIEMLFENGSTEEMRRIPWMRPHFMTAEGDAVLSIHALIVETPDRRIVVDTCLGNDKQRPGQGNHMMQTDFLQRLEAAGFARDGIDHVLCTHMHVDHVGWNTMLVDGRWVPTFPKARYLFDRVEHAHMIAGMANRPLDDVFEDRQLDSFVDSVQPIFDAGLADLVDTPYRLCDEVELIPSRGHSIGHVSVRVRSRGEEALITGDMTHHPCQLVHVDWSPGFEHDRAEGTRTRAALFADAADRGVLMIGTHWAGPTAGRLLRDGDVYRLTLD
jgi:glyoxylase-like metal-dependent hydrolase (beta-lactamase superfamily II)